jgi:hypothetical protein
VRPFILAFRLLVSTGRLLFVVYFCDLATFFFVDTKMRHRCFCLHYNGQSSRDTGLGALMVH